VSWRMYYEMQKARSCQDKL